MGLTRVHSTYEGQPREERCTPTYRAPESDLASSMSPKYDVWSLGCLLLEFATWAVAGWDAVEHTFPTARTTALSRCNDFSSDDSFFEVQSDEDFGAQRAHIKESVIKVIFITMSFSFAFNSIAKME
jgi:serine/threonine protein kinase